MTSPCFPGVFLFSPGIVQCPPTPSRYWPLVKSQDTKAREDRANCVVLSASPSQDCNFSFFDFNFRTFLTFSFFLGTLTLSLRLASFRCLATTWLLQMTPGTPPSVIFDATLCRRAPRAVCFTCSSGPLLQTLLPSNVASS